MSLVRLLGFTTLGCGCVSGRYREVGSEPRGDLHRGKGRLLRDTQAISATSP